MVTKLSKKSFAIFHWKQSLIFEFESHSIQWEKKIQNNSYEDRTLGGSVHKFKGGEKTGTYNGLELCYN